MEPYALLMSISPKYVKKIIARRKTVELRRRFPRIKPGGKILIYSSCPDKALIGTATVGDVISLTVNQLWQRYEYRMGINQEEFRDYLKGVSVGCAIELKTVEPFLFPVSLSTLRKIVPGFHPPQSYQYFTEKKYQIFLDSVRNYSQTHTHIKENNESDFTFEKAVMRATIA